MPNEPNLYIHKFSSAYYSRGEYYYFAGNIPAAIEDFHKVVEINKNGILGLVTQGIIKIQEGSYTIAIENFNKAAQLEPNLGDAYQYKGIAYQKQDNRAAQIADWRKAAQLHKKIQHPKLQKGSELAQKARYF